MAARIQHALRQGFATLLLTAIALPGLSASDNAADAGRESRIRVSRTLKQPGLQAEITAQAGMSGDVFPAFASHLAGEPAKVRESGVVQVKLANPASSDQTLRARVSVRITGWSEEEQLNADLPPGTSKTLNFAPPLNERALRNREIAPALAQVRVQDASGELLFAESVAVKMRSGDDMYWGVRFQEAPMIASWVTPHDSAVERLLAQAKHFTVGRRLPGYESWKDEAAQEVSTRQQARAIYLAVQRQGVSYVKSSLTFGSAVHINVAQRIRKPHESLTNASANCIDGAVMFASAFENLGLHPEIIVVPGHAYVGVRLAEASNRYLLIDTALVARVPFERAVATADKGIKHWNDDQVTRISISDARQHGIFPMPAE